jgi:ribonuclease HII
MAKTPFFVADLLPMSPRTESPSAIAERLEHLRGLIEFDRLMLHEHSEAEFIIGTDEVGRGCLAGPVVAAAVILPPIVRGSVLEEELCRLNDSKLVPPDLRADLADRLKEICQWAVAEASVEEIDEINILQASLLAMRRAVKKLKAKAPHVILIDGNKKIPSIRTKQVTVIGGDGKSASIAAASVIAKVHRDTFMIKLAKKFPEYLWNSNKGYRSNAHYQALEQVGITKWHRRSFNLLGNRESAEPDDGESEELD